MKTQEQNILEEQIAVIQIADKEVYGYAIYRSPVQAKYVNIVAVNSDFEPLFVRYADLTIEEAEVMLEMISKENQQNEKGTIQ